MVQFKKIDFIIMWKLNATVLFLVWFSINDMKYSTLYYKIGSLLDDFAQLLATVSAVSTFKVS
jgi:hypothetical protein